MRPEQEPGRALALAYPGIRTPSNLKRIKARPDLTVLSLKFPYGNHRWMRVAADDCPNLREAGCCKRHDRRAIFGRRYHCFACCGVRNLAGNSELRTCCPRE